jgi:hypothetical protein
MIYVIRVPARRYFIAFYYYSNGAQWIFQFFILIASFDTYNCVVDKIDFRPMLFISNSIASLTESEATVVFKNENYYSTRVFDVILCFQAIVYIGWVTKCLSAVVSLPVQNPSDHKK